MNLHDEPSELDIETQVTGDAFITPTPCAMAMARIRHRWPETRLRAFIAPLTRPEMQLRAMDRVGEIPAEHGACMHAPSDPAGCWRVRCQLGKACVEASEVEQLRERVAQLEAQLDGAYLERNQVVAALAKCFPAGTANTPIDGWAPEWHGCVYIDLPTGQASWHFHERERHLFAGLPAYAGAWDGHSTPEKYARLDRLQPTRAMTLLQEACLDWSAVDLGPGAVRVITPPLPPLRVTFEQPVLGAMRAGDGLEVLADGRVRIFRDDDLPNLQRGQVTATVQRVANPLDTPMSTQPHPDGPITVGQLLRESGPAAVAAPSTAVASSTSPSTAGQGGA